MVIAVGWEIVLREGTSRCNGRRPQRTRDAPRRSRGRGRASISMTSSFADINLSHLGEGTTTALNVTHEDANYHHYHYGIFFSASVGRTFIRGAGRRDGSTHLDWKNRRKWRSDTYQKCSVWIHASTRCLSGNTHFLYREKLFSYNKHNYLSVSTCKLYNNDVL